MTIPSKPLDWIREIDSALLALEEKPQFGLPKAFDWEKLQLMMRELFNQPSLQISQTLKGWVEAQDALKGLGEDLSTLTLDFTSLETPAYFITTEQDLKRLMGNLLGGEESASFFFDTGLTKGFYNYFAIEVLHLLEQLDFAVPLTPRLGKTPSDLSRSIDQPCFVIDLSLILNQKTFGGRLLLPKRFRSAWKSFFSQLPPPPLTEEMRKKIVVDIGLEMGYSQLGFDDWKHVRVGDFILLDHCSYDPEGRKGGVQLTLNGSPILRGRFKENSIKLTGYPVFEEVREDMDDEDLFDDENDEDLYGDLDEDLETENEELFDEEEDGEENKISAEVLPEGEKVSITPEELPIHLRVEVGRLRMSAQELMQLTPGNLLELNVSPEQGVDLIINGKKVGRGELIRMGETLGVRILSL